MYSCSLYITTAHFHLGNRYSISHFFTAAKTFHVPKSVSNRAKISNKNSAWKQGCSTNSALAWFLVGVLEWQKIFSGDWTCNNCLTKTPDTRSSHLSTRMKDVEGSGPHSSIFGRQLYDLFFPPFSSSDSSPELSTEEAGSGRGLSTRPPAPPDRRSRNGANQAAVNWLWRL